jgi:hypothetical protein
MNEWIRDPRREIVSVSDTRTGDDDDSARARDNGGELARRRHRQRRRRSVSHVRPGPFRNLHYYCSGGNGVTSYVRVGMHTRTRSMVPMQQGAGAAPCTVARERDRYVRIRKSIKSQQKTIQEYGDPGPSS